MTESFLKHGLGVRPYLPSTQDYDESTDSIPGSLKNQKEIRSIKDLIEALKLKPETLNEDNGHGKVNLRGGCSPIDCIGSATIRTSVL